MAQEGFDVNTSKNGDVRVECGKEYHTDEISDEYWNHPTDYRHGYKTYCLACWLGVGPEGMAEEDRDDAYRAPSRAR